MSDRLIALDVTMARLGTAGTHVYITELARSLELILGDRLRPIASRLAAPSHVPRTTGDRLRTLGRDLWWHQVGVTLAARRAGAAVLHLPAGIGPVTGRLATVLTIHDLNVLRFPRFFTPWSRHYTHLVLPRVARGADAIITVSRASKADIVQRLGISDDRVTVVPNGIDAAFAPPAPESREDVQRRYGLPPQFVLTVGSVEPRKNLPRLLEAIHRLRTRPATSEVMLVHVGPQGWLANGVADTLHALRLEDAVRFLGYVPRRDLVALYGLARLCAYPALYEGFGLPVAEAMACGCPVVTSNVSSLPEVAGDAAVLVDPGSVEAIAAGIAALWTDEARRGDLARRGQERARGFTWERAARATAAVYEAVAP